MEGVAQNDCWDDASYVADMVREDGCLLERASQRLRDNKEIVSLAVEWDRFSGIDPARTQGRALKFASDRLKNDKDFLRVAVGNNGF